MNPVRPQNTPESPTLLNDLKAEVSAESAPLLQFIVRNSGLIVGVVVVLLVALVGTAVWRWHQGGLQAEAQTELARIGITMKGGDRLKALDDLAATGAAAMSLDHAVDLRRAKERFAGRMAVMGNIDPVSIMMRGGPDDVRRVAQKCFDDAGEGGGFIFGAGCAEPNGTPIENVRAMVETSMANPYY